MKLTINSTQHPSNQPLLDLLASVVNFPADPEIERIHLVWNKRSRMVLERQRPKSVEGWVIYHIGFSNEPADPDALGQVMGGGYTVQAGLAPQHYMDWVIRSYLDSIGVDHSFIPPGPKSRIPSDHTYVLSPSAEEVMGFIPNEIEALFRPRLDEADRELWNACQGISVDWDRRLKAMVSLRTMALAADQALDHAYETSGINREIRRRSPMVAGLTKGIEILTNQMRRPILERPPTKDMDPEFKRMVFAVNRRGMLFGTDMEFIWDQHTSKLEHDPGREPLIEIPLHGPNIYMATPYGYQLAWDIWGDGPEKLDRTIRPHWKYPEGAKAERRSTVIESPRLYYTELALSHEGEYHRKGKAFPWMKNEIAYARKMAAASGTTPNSDAMIAIGRTNETADLPLFQENT